MGNCWVWMLTRRRWRSLARPWLLTKSASIWRKPPTPLITKQLAALHWDAVDGIVLDLGASSMQFDNAERGFSFMQDAPLDMRFGPHAFQSADDIVNTFDERELADLIFRYGEDRDSRKIARAIVMSRPLHTTRELVAVIEKASPRRGDRVHPATQTFQALRIAVNEELASVESVLPQAVSSLKPAEDSQSSPSIHWKIASSRISSANKARTSVNPPYERIYEEERKAVVKIVNKKPIMASDDEIKDNPRARSAKLRVIEKI